MAGGAATAGGGGGDGVSFIGDASADGGNAAGPRLQAWLEDLSQNGTFINGTLVGRNKQQALQHGDRIEMVFPSGRNPPQANNAFPIFTYYVTRPGAESEPKPDTGALSQGSSHPGNETDE